jgi:hypothetical protein
LLHQKTFNFTTITKLIFMNALNYHLTIFHIHVIIKISL